MCKKIISTALLILWMGVIFGFSAQPAADSSQLSGAVRETVVKIVEKVFPSLLDEADKEQTDGGLLTALIRKTAHFSCYLVLGILAMFTLLSYGVEKKRYLFALVFCILYAVSDEVHQVFVPGRAGRVTDVLIDTAGSAAGIYIFIAFKNRFCYSAKE